MKLYKTWILNKTDFNESDYLWCKKYANTVQVHNNTGTISTFGGQSYTYFKGSTITVETVTQEQENMLHLKYGSMLLLMAEWRDHDHDRMLIVKGSVY